MNTSKERKETPVFSGVLQYFPDAINAIARQSWAGNEKHNPGEPLHWAREKSCDHMDCAIRHMMTPDEVDPETNETHLVAAAWRILAALQLQCEARAEGEIEGDGVPIDEAFRLDPDLNPDFTFVVYDDFSSQIGDTVYSAHHRMSGIVQSIEERFDGSEIEYTITATPVETAP